MKKRATTEATPVEQQYRCAMKQIKVVLDQWADGELRDVDAFYAIRCVHADLRGDAK